MQDNNPNNNPNNPNNNNPNSTNTLPVLPFTRGIAKQYTRHYRDSRRLRDILDTLRATHGLNRVRMRTPSRDDENHVRMILDKNREKFRDRVGHLVPLVNEAKSIHNRCSHFSLIRNMLYHSLVDSGILPRDTFDLIMSLLPRDDHSEFYRVMAMFRTCKICGCQQDRCWHPPDALSRIMKRRTR